MRFGSRALLAFGVTGLAAAAACASGASNDDSSAVGAVLPGGPGVGGSSLDGGTSGAGGSASGAAGTTPGNGGTAVNPFPDGGTAGASGGGAAGHAGATPSGGSPGGGSAGAPGGGGGGSAGMATAGTTGSAGTAGGGGGGCVPSCGTKQCGPDGCNGVCGTCNANQTCDATGTCVATAQPTWAASVPGASFASLALDSSGTLYAAGAMSGAAWLGAIDPGTGALGVATAVGPSPGAATVVRFVNGSLVVGGWSDFGSGSGADGLVAAYAPGSLGVSIAPSPLFGSASFDEVRGLDVAPSGIAWLVGVSSTTGTGGLGSPWGISQQPGGTVCGFPLDATTMSVARDVALVGTTAYVVGVENGQGVFAAFDATASCAATVISGIPLAIGTAATDPKHMIVLGGVAYVVGNADDGTGAYGFLASIDLATMTVTAAYHDIVPTRAYSSIATDGTNLCIGGTQAGNGYVGLWTTSFASVWVAGGALPKGTDDVLGVACDGTSLYAAGANGGLAKCTAACVCPM